MDSEPSPVSSRPASGGTNLAAVCIRRPVFATMMNLLLVVLGWFSFQRIGTDLFPNVELPIITVTTTLRGASPEEIETSVTKPLEEIINTIEGVDELSSISREGISRITVQFLYERNRDAAAQDVRDKVSSILSQLPDGTETPIIGKFDLDALPVISISMSGPRDLREITYIADKTIKQNLETVLDVGAVNVVGGRARAIQISADVERLRARGLTIDDVRQALKQQNLELPEGRVDQGSRELTVRTLGRMQAVPDFNQLIVGNSGGQPIFLRDVATISDSVEEPRSLARLNGENSVTVVVRKQSGVNTVAVIDRVKAKLKELEAVIPPDLKLTLIRDQSTFIKRSLDEVSFHLLFGALLVALTVFFFLHDWRGTVIACVAIPSSIIATFALMRVMHFTLNNFTMLGLVFAVGIVIDDAIVVLENVHRTMEEKGMSALEAAFIGTKEIALAVLATTLSLVVIFLPLAFMQGRVGRFFSSYGVTVAFAIMVSLFVSFTLTPMLASRFLRHTDDEKLREKKAHGGWLMQWLSAHYLRVLGWSLRHRWLVMLGAGLCVASRFLRHTDDEKLREKKAHGGWLMQWLSAHYLRVLGWSLRHRWLVMLGAGLCVASLVPLTKHTRFTYFPQDDTSEFEVALQTPEGMTLERTAEVANEIETKLKAIRVEGQPAITDTLLTVGETTGNVGKGEGVVNLAEIYCRMPTLGGFWSTLLGQTRRWSLFDAMAAARKILAEYPDVRAAAQTISPIGQGGRNAELQFNIIGPDLDKLTDYTAQIMDRMRANPGIVDVDTTASNRKPELQVHIDRGKASQFGVRVWGRGEE